jgi:outer membrane lipoprotein SlyB
MRISCITLAIAAFALMGCARNDSAHRDDPAARQAGREAYRATQDIKRCAK